MDENENLYDKIKELFGTVPRNFSILEEKIDIELQMEYFEYSRNLRTIAGEDNLKRLSESLFSAETSCEDKREVLVRLASMESVEAYRLIEKYMSEPASELREWGILAFQESKMLLESKLLDENQVFISTGLGGKGDKLRYFVVLIRNRKQAFSRTEKKIIRNEFDFVLKKYASEIEKIRFSGSLSAITAIVPMQATIKSIFEEAVYECNQFGGFLMENFIITNVKELSFKEIRDFLKTQRLNNNKND